MEPQKFFTAKKINFHEPQKFISKPPNFLPQTLSSSKVLKYNGVAFISESNALKLYISTPLTNYLHHYNENLNKISYVAHKNL